MLTTEKLVDQDYIIFMMDKVINKWARISIFKKERECHIHKIRRADYKRTY